MYVCTISTHCDFIPGRIFPMWRPNVFVFSTTRGKTPAIKLFKKLPDLIGELLQEMNQSEGFCPVMYDKEELIFDFRYLFNMMLAI
jgi:hypothetical protein